MRTLFLASSVVIALAASAFAQDGSVKVGALFGTTGPQANFGVPYSDGLRLAVKEINDQGGVKAGDKAYTIDLVLADTKSDPAQAVAEAQRMMADGVKLFFCCNLSSEAVPVLKSVLPAGALMVSPNSATTPLLSKPGHDLLIHAGNTESGDRGSTALWVNFLVENFQPKSVGIIVPSDEAGQIYGDTYKKAFEAKGVNVVAVEVYDHGATDFTPLLTSLRPHKPDLLVAGYSDEVRGIFRQATELGIQATYVGTVGVSGAAGEGLPVFAYPGWTRYIGPEQTDPKVVAYMDSLKAITGKDLTPFSFWSIMQYDWMHMLADAMEKAGTVTDTAAIAQAMKSQVYNGMVSWQVDEKGLGRQDMEGIILKDGAVDKMAVITVPPAND